MVADGEQPVDTPIEADLQLFGAISQELLAALNLKELLWKVVRVVGDALSLHYLAIALLEPNQHLVFLAAHGGGLDNEAIFAEKHEDFSLTIDQGITGRSVRLQQPVVVDDVSADPDYYAVSFLPETKSEVAVPIMRAGRVLGVIDAQETSHAAFDPRLVRQLELIAPLIGVAIENARVLDRLAHQNRRSELSAALSRIAVGATDVSDIARRVSLRLREEFNVSYAGVSIYRARGRRLERVGHDGVPGFAPEAPSEWRAGVGLMGRAVQSGCTLVFDAEVEGSRADALSPKSQSEIAVPLTSGGKVVGALHLASDRPEQFHPEDAQLLEAVAGPVAHALANAAAMDRLERLRGELSGMIVHDLRNPLMVVLTALRVLERVPGVQKDPHCQRYLRNAGSAGDEVLRLIGSLLDLQKLESGELTLQCTEFSLADVIRRVVTNNQILAEVEEVDLKMELRPDLPSVRADLDLVLRTVDNLVGNAVKFTPAGGSVLVGVRLATAEELVAHACGGPVGMLVEVIDSGEGIPEEEQERIFEKFGVVESRKRQVKVSTGLGLAMCKLVITSHGGQIWVDSEVGQGSRFAFILPCE